MSGSDPNAAPQVPTPPAAPPAAPPAYGAPAAPPAYGAPAPGYQTPPAQPGAYPTPAYGAAPAYAATPAYGGYANAPKTNTLAIISMIASIVGFLWILPFVGSLAGAIMGHISLGQIKRTGEGGRGMALAGVIVGWVGLAFFVIGIIIFVAFISFATMQSDGINPLVP